MGITNWSIRHSVTILVLMFVIVVIGMSSYNGLPREAAPDITIPFVLVTTPYLGVSPADIETLVTDPLEEELEQLKDVRELRSTSAEGASIISIEFEPYVDIDDALQKIRERVDAAQREIPADAEDSIISEISFSEFPILIINISGDVGLLRLKEIGEQIQDRIEHIQGVLDVNVVGGVDREITVEADPARLEFYRVSINELIGAIQRENINMPGGLVELGELNYSVRVPGEFEAVEEIGRLVIREEDGVPIYVEDVAEVIDAPEQRTTYSRLNGVDSVSISVSRRAGENIPVIADEIKAIISDFEVSYGEQVRFTVLADVSQEIELRVVELENNILTGLLLVVSVLIFFMGGLRNAIFVAIAIPGSMLITFAVLGALGITLNIVVLFSLVLALGMLVDNAIVIVENIYRHGQMGKPLTQAAMDGVKEVAWPVIASTGTTVGAFLPMMFWPGIMGEFMSFLPLTVILVLTASLFVALVINPVICALFMKVKPSKHKTLLPDDDPLAATRREMETLPRNFIYKTYGFFLTFSLKHRWLVTVLVIAAFVGTFSYYGKNNHGMEFFPETTPEQAFINVTLPDGSNLEASDRIVRLVEASLADQENIDTWVADVGAGGGGNPMNFGGGGNAPHQSRITIDFLDTEVRVESPYDTLARIRGRISSIVGAEVEIAKADMGPPSGPPINIELVGPDYAVLGELSLQLRQHLREVDGLVNVTDDFESGRPEITVNVDREAAAGVQISTRDVANTVRSAINGVEASVFREADEEYDILVRLPEQYRNSLEDIERLTILLRSGEYVAITEVAEIRVEEGYGSIRHLDSDRVVTVSAEVAEGVNADAKLREVQGLLGESLAVPAAYEVRYTGQNQEQAEAQAFMSRALMIAVFIIALILVTQFNSVLQPGIILVSVILSLLGVLWALLLRGMPFNLIMTGVGIISLVGVVVNNSIVLIDYANQLKARGLPRNEAVVQAGMVRFRPVMLTAITTILSLMPIVLGFSLDVKNFAIQEGGSSVEMWGPMANAVVAGLAAATFLTLIVVPVIYSQLDSFKAFFVSIRTWRNDARERRLLRREERRQRRARKKALQSDVGTPEAA